MIKIYDIDEDGLKLPEYFLQIIPIQENLLHSTIKSILQIGIQKMSKY